MRPNRNIPNGPTPVKVSFRVSRPVAEALRAAARDSGCSLETVVLELLGRVDIDALTAFLDSRMAAHQARIDRIKEEGES